MHRDVRCVISESTRPKLAAIGLPEDRHTLIPPTPYQKIVAKPLGLPDATLSLTADPFYGNDRFYQVFKRASLLAPGIRSHAEKTAGDAQS
eukprot:207886-Rhodomonas_salina.2